MRHRRLAGVILLLIALFYGFLFALGTTFILVQLVAPLALMGVLIIMLLPDSGKTHLRPQEYLLYAFLIGMFCWPDYIAIAVPGLPWITVMRLTTIPLAIVFLLNLSQSRAYRGRIMEVARASSGVWAYVVAITLLAALSVAFSDKLTMSMNRLVVFLLSNTLMYFVALDVLARPGRIVKVGYIIWFSAMFVCLLGIPEWYYRSLPWIGHIPSFLKIDPEMLQQITAPKARAATGIYRVQSRFTTPLGLAEFLVMATPFVIHFMVLGRSFWIRIAAGASLPLIVFIVYCTDTRLGILGLLLSAVIYLLGWGVLRWRSDRRSLFGPAVVMSYPVIFLLFVLSTFFLGRVRGLVWGNGPQQASNLARQEQIMNGIPMVLQKPWGHGISRAAETLGFRGEDGILTIDSYYLSVALELGILGLILFCTLFILSLISGAKQAIYQFDEDTSFIIPVFISLANFVVIKTILSQQENHPFAFLMLGAMTCLCFAIRKHRQDLSDAEDGRPVSDAPLRA